MQEPECSQGVCDPSVWRGTVIDVAVMRRRWWQCALDAPTEAITSGSCAGAMSLLFLLQILGT